MALVAQRSAAFSGGAHVGGHTVKPAGDAVFDSSSVEEEITEFMWQTLVG
ncbi:hypothetical protein [Cryptosporangium phraense]|nr:hypothetical protein [Cryptosporangium phraense]